jgi:hypothetical protein
MLLTSQTLDSRVLPTLIPRKGQITKFTCNLGLGAALDMTRKVFRANELFFVVRARDLLLRTPLPEVFERLFSFKLSPAVRTGEKQVLELLFESFVEGHQVAHEFLVSTHRALVLQLL